MPGLAPTSRRRVDTLQDRAAAPGRLRHGRGEQVGRHRHAHAFAAVVLAGEYVEVGDTGCHRVGPGSVLFHDAFEAHRHVAGSAGAEVFVLPVERPAPMAHGQVADADAVVRLAERDWRAAAAALIANSVPTWFEPRDWPELLARELCADPRLGLAAWAERHGLHAGSLSRGFRALFGVTPAQFRAVQKSRRAVAALTEIDRPLSDVAIASGFADQAHMARAVRARTGRTASELRGRLS